MFQPPHALLHLTILTCRAGVELLQDNTDTRFSHESDFWFLCGILSSVSFENADILSPVPLKGIRSHRRVEGAELVSLFGSTFHLCCFLLLSLWSVLNSLTTNPRPVCRGLNLIPLNVREHRRRICHLFSFLSPQPARITNGGMEATDLE